MPTYIDYYIIYAVCIYYIYCNNNSFSHLLGRFVNMFILADDIRTTVFRLASDITRTNVFLPVVSV